MLTLILTFIKTHWQATLIGSGVFAVIATFSIQHFRIDHYENELKACRAENVTLEDSNKKLVASVESQNDAIAALQQAGLTKRHAATQALSKARLRAAKHDARAAQIENAKGTADECADLKNLINGYASSRR